MSIEAVSHGLCLPIKAGETLKKSWGSFLVLGAALVVFGCVAMCTPAAISGKIVWILGGILAFGGMAQFICGFRSSGVGRFFPAILNATLYLFAGILMMANPVLGTPILTLLLAVFFVAEGTFKVLLAWDLHPARYWEWMMLSGAMAVVFGIILPSAWPCSASWMLALLLGIDLAVTGTALVLMGLASHPHPQEPNG